MAKTILVVDDKANTRELLARLHGALRVADVVPDSETRSVKVGARAVEGPTRSEFDLLATLMESPAKLASQTQTRTRPGPSALH